VATSATEDYAAGQAVTHMPMMEDPNVSMRAIPGGDCIGEFSADVAFYLPSDLSLCELWSRGQPLHRGTAELSVWYEGGSYESRQVIARGYIEVDAFALGGEMVTASILMPDPESTDTIPGSADVCSDETLNPYQIVGGASIGFTLPDDVAGAPYPFPLGRPGLFVDAAGTSQDVPASPALLITQAAAQQRLLVAARQVGAGNITIVNANAEGLAPPMANFGISYIIDENGITLSTVDPTSIGTWKFDGTETFYCAGWTDGITFDNGALIRGLGDAALYMLRLVRGAAVFDLGRWEAARATLNTIAIGGYVDQAVDPWTIITEQFLAGFPRCVVMPGPDGLYPAIFEAVPPDECVELVEGRDFYLLDGVRPEYATDETYSSIRVEYALNTASQNYNGLCVLGPRTDDLSESGHEAASRSYSWTVGQDGGPTRETKTIQSAWIWEHASAARVADDVMQLTAERLPSVKVALLDQVMWRTLPIGLAVRFTSPTLGWSQVPAWVCGLNMALLDEVELLMRPRP